MTTVGPLALRLESLLAGRYQANRFLTFATVSEPLAEHQTKWQSGLSELSICFPPKSSLDMEACGSETCLWVGDTLTLARRNPGCIWSSPNLECLFRGLVPLRRGVRLTLKCRGMRLSPSCSFALAFLFLRSLFQQSYKGGVSCPKAATGFQTLS